MNVLFYKRPLGFIKIFAKEEFTNHLKLWDKALVFNENASGFCICASCKVGKKLIGGKST